MKCSQTPQLYHSIYTMYVIIIDIYMLYYNGFQCASAYQFYQYGFNSNLGVQIPQAICYPNLSQRELTLQSEYQLVQASDRDVK